MAAQLAGLLPPSMAEKIKSSKLLVVGAGGIGCEVLKNLVLCGFPEIEVIDLDTIDLSNLNRQFLFRHEHIGKSKAKVAREAVLKFNPNVKITAHHDTIMSEAYGITYFNRFDVVLSALDNRAARNHVNRMCLNANVPLIESGTAGYNGQVEIIKRGLTQCYECTPKPKEKTYPGCTIRNTPSEPIHCIVWAKHLFNQLFGESQDDEDISPDVADTSSEDADNKAESNVAELNGNIKRVSTRQWANDCNYDAVKLFNKFFDDDIKYLISMSHLWSSRRQPQSVTHESIMAGNADCSVKPQEFDYHKIWSLQECVAVFESCLAALKQQLASADNLYWDKDDQPAMDFVAACANIRASIFGIECKSRFEIKSMAGNIIPAIATTNAITAGLCVMRAINVIRGELDRCKAVYTRQRKNGFNQIIIPEKVFTQPNPKCVVCSVAPAIHLAIDTQRMRLCDFRDKVLIKALNMLKPDVTLASTGAIIISSDEDDADEEFERKLLHDLKIVDGVVLTCDDFVQSYSFTLIINYKAAGRDDELFEVLSGGEELKPQAVEPQNQSDAADEADEPTSTQNNNHDIDDDDDDDFEIIEEPIAGMAVAEQPVPSTSGAKPCKKRAIEEGLQSVALTEESGAAVVENGHTPAKRPKIVDATEQPMDTGN